MAHSLIQAFDDEATAFATYIDEFPETTTLLVDTYDTLEGVRNAIRIAEQARSRGSAINAIRLDSGDLGELAREARALLDEAGFPQIRIMASGGLDEHSISQLVNVRRAHRRVRRRHAIRNILGCPVHRFGLQTRRDRRSPSNQVEHRQSHSTLGQTGIPSLRRRRDARGRFNEIDVADANRVIARIQC